MGDRLQTSRTSQLNARFLCDHWNLVTFLGRRSSKPLLTATTAGLYINIFETKMPHGSVAVKVASRDRYPDLRALRDQFSGHSFYADRREVLCYGADEPAPSHFVNSQIEYHGRPRFAAHVVEESMAAHLRSRYFVADEKRLQVFRRRPAGITSRGGVSVHQGYDIRPIYWFDHLTTRFGIVVDVKWMLLRDGAPVWTAKLKSLGEGVVREVAQIQGELLRGSGRINTEISRQRLLSDIIPFVQGLASLPLRAGGQAHVDPEPARVIQAGDKG